jgi:spore maturation protein SpmA
MMNALWVAMVLVALVTAAFSGTVDAVAKAVTDSAGTAVTLAIGLVGTMALWLGLMRVLQQAGLLKVFARVMAPVLRKLFPELPDGHPALSMMVLNIASTMLGLGNAATPFGLKAMTELDTLNPEKGTATNAMCLFLAINSAGFQLIPTNAIAIRAAVGSHKPGAIFFTTLIATTCSTLTAVLVCKVCERFSKRPMVVHEPLSASADTPEITAARALIEGEKLVPSALRLSIAAVVGVTLLVGLVLQLHVHSGDVGMRTAMRDAAATWPLVLILAGIVLYGFARGVKVYDCVVQGGKEGFDVALRIIPFLVAMLVAIGMLRASGAIAGFVALMSPLTDLVGMPAEALPMAVLRPLSGSGSLSLMTETMKTHGPDSLVGEMVSTMYGGTETTFYVLALYFGVVGIRNARHTLIPCIAADVVGALAAVWAVRLLLV